MGLVARGSPGKGCASAVAVPPPQPPAYGSASSLLLLAPVVFCKGFHQNDACSTGTHRRKPRRCRLEIMHRGEGRGSATGASHGYVSTRSPHATSTNHGWIGIYGLSRHSGNGRDGVIPMAGGPGWLRARRTPHHRAHRRRAHRCPAPHGQDVSAAGGATRWHQPRVPTVLPHLPAEQIHLSLPAAPPGITLRAPASPAASVLALPTPQIPWGSAESRRSGILLAPETQPERSDLRIFTEIWAMPRLPSERTRPATCGGSIRLPARHERTLGFQCRPLFTACFWGRSGEGRSTGVTAQHGWAAAVNTLPGSGPAPPPVNHSCPWKKFMPGQPVPTAALKTPQGGEGEGLETPPHRPSGVTSCGSIPPVVPLMSPPMPLGTTPSPPATPRILSHTCPELAGALPGTLRRAEPAGNVPGKTN